LSNLRGEKRTIMEGMLETVKTDALRATFNKLLPVVLDETSSTRRGLSSSTATKRPLMEVNQKRPVSSVPSVNGNVNPQRNTSTVVTGDNQRATRLFESAQAETTDFNDDIAQVVRLAGIQK